jgi:hypothetical protein
MSELQRSTRFYQDKHSVTPVMEWKVTGENGCVVWTVSPWEKERSGLEDFGFHWKHQTSHRLTRIKDCQHLGGECYYDGSTLRAIDVLDSFMEFGEEAVWEALESSYRYMVNQHINYSEEYWKAALYEEID